MMHSVLSFMVLYIVKQNGFGARQPFCFIENLTAVLEHVPGYAFYACLAKGAAKLWKNFFLWAVELLLHAPTRARFWLKLHHVSSKRVSRGFCVRLVVAIGKIKQLELNICACMVVRHYIPLRIGIHNVCWAWVIKTNKQSSLLLCSFAKKKKIPTLCNKF